MCLACRRVSESLGGLSSADSQTLSDFSVCRGSMFLSNIWVFYQCFIKHLGVSGRGIPAHVWRSSGLHASVAASSGMFLRLLKLDGGTDGARDVPVGSAPRHASSCLQLAPFLRGVPTAEPLVFLSGDAGPTGCSSFLETWAGPRGEPRVTGSSQCPSLRAQVAGSAWTRRPAARCRSLAV